jgi:hypothetical protein
MPGSLAQTLLAASLYLVVHAVHQVQQYATTALPVPPNILNGTIWKNPFRKTYRSHFWQDHFLSHTMTLLAPRLSSGARGGVSAYPAFDRISRNPVR